jgi:hypothetical protein
LRDDSRGAILAEPTADLRVIGCRRAIMLVTMKNSDLIDKLVTIADGNLDLVQEAIRACAKGADGADLKEVVDYIVQNRPAAPAAA